MLNMHISKSTMKLLKQPQVLSQSRVNYKRGNCQVKANWSERQQQILQNAKKYYEVAWLGNAEALREVMTENHIQRDLSRGTVFEGRDYLEKAHETVNQIYSGFNIKVLDFAATEDGNSVFLHIKGEGVYLKDEQGNFIEEGQQGKETTFLATSLLKFNQEGKIEETKIFREIIPF